MAQPVVFRCATALPTAAAFAHMPTAIDGSRGEATRRSSHLSSTTLGNLKSNFAGAFHSLKYRKYPEHYFAAFAYRFNRRFDLRGLITRLIVDISRYPPAEENAVRMQLKQVTNQ